MNSLDEYRVVVELPILWGNMDAFGHVNNTVPLRWFESSRVAYVEQLGMVDFMRGAGLGPILASIRCDYLRQLHYPDTVRVGARVARLGNTSLVIEHLLVSDKLQVAAARGQSTVVIFDYQNQRPVRVPQEFRDAVERFEGRPIPTDKEKDHDRRA